MKLSACPNLTFRPLTGTWYRAIGQEHWETRLAARHTSRDTTRFNAGSVVNASYQVFYLSENHLRALFEARALLGTSEAPIPDPRGTWTTLNLGVVLHGVADLTNPREQRRIGTSAQELTGKWDPYKNSGKAPTQLLGAALFNLPGVEGFLAPTALSGISGKNLIVFSREADAVESDRIP
jgi:RES domain